ncbi:hypothetical protein [Bradyrhizobium sp. USDA 336]|uniref:hypothetical protein n=1 Tax=Bradyrhizobium sp. USDA 336 TaxID=3156311 RepID=UPI003832546B
MSRQLNISQGGFVPFDFDQAIKKDIEKRRNELLESIRNGLIVHLSSKSHPLHLAAKKVDTTVSRIRAAMAMAFPDLTETNETIRAILYGETPDLEARRKTSFAPLLHFNNIVERVRNIPSVEQWQKVKEPGEQYNSDKWDDDVLLISCGKAAIEAPKLLAIELERVIHYDFPL